MHYQRRRHGGSLSVAPPIVPVPDAGDECFQLRLSRQVAAGAERITWPPDPVLSSENVGSRFLSLLQSVPDQTLSAISGSPEKPNCRRLLRDRLGGSRAERYGTLLSERHFLSEAGGLPNLLYKLRHFRSLASLWNRNIIIPFACCSTEWTLQSIEPAPTPGASVRSGELAPPFDRGPNASPRSSQTGGIVSRVGDRIPACAGGRIVSALHPYRRWGAGVADRESGHSSGDRQSSRGRRAPGHRKSHMSLTRLPPRLTRS